MNVFLTIEAGTNICRRYEVAAGVRRQTHAFVFDDPITPVRVELIRTTPGALETEPA